MNPIKRSVTESTTDTMTLDPRLPCQPAIDPLVGAGLKADGPTVPPGAELLSVPITDELRQQLERYFPGRPLDDLCIRYYQSVEDVGRDYFTQKIVPACTEQAEIRYLGPFIAFVKLGEALMMTQKEGVIIYDTRDGDRCTETGPFWFVVPRT